MSTVQSLLDNMQFRVDVDADLYHLINLAIRAITKRLYWHDSDILISDMTAYVYAAFTYETDTIALVDSNPDTITDTNSGFTAKTKTATTIAFVSGSPATITDSGSGFTAAGFAKGQVITTDDTDNPGPFTIATVAAGTLTLDSDDELISKAAGSSVTITSKAFVSGMRIQTDNANNTGTYEINTVAAGTLTLVSTDSLTAVSAGSDIALTVVDKYGSLPSDFWGLISSGGEEKNNLYIEGKTYPLIPSPGISKELLLTSPGEPRFYKIKGTKIYLFPPPSENVVVKGDYLVKPTAVTAKTDTLPYNEIFDDAIGELVAFFYSKDLSSQSENYILLEKMCNELVDLVATRRGKTHPKPMPEGIDWDYMMRNG